MIYETFNSEETKKLGFEIGEKAKKGDIFCLFGELGAGKTMFVKGFANALGINEDITSPTFTIINEYTNIVLPLYHFDVYRINSVYEMEDTGYEDYFYGDGVCLVEWANMIKELIPENAIWVEIKRDLYKGENYRKIEIVFNK